MGKLIKKEFVLAMHPTVPLMMLLAAMLLIPNYPYGVIFFYMSLSIFFTCLSGRENGDVIYSLTLPVAKRDIVRARIGYAVLLELVQIALLIPLSLLRAKLIQAGNAAGMDANIALLGEGFLLFGIFNFCFFVSYYKNIKRVGICFAKSSVVFFLCIAADVCCSYALPFVRDVLDTPDPAFLTEKLVFTAVCALIYAALSFAAMKISIFRFERQDI